MKKSALYLATLCLLQSTLHADVPLYVNYQGRATDSTGLPLGATGTATSYVAAPVNRKILFRFYDAATGGNRLWTEEQTVTISVGEFSVLLGQGIAPTGTAAGESHPAIDTVFTSGTASRFLEVTVDNGDGSITAADTPVTPRQQITTSSYSFRSKTADGIASSADLTINPVTGTATNYGLGWYGTGRTFNSVALDGPVLYGNSGGGLGSNVSGTQKLALVWNASGQVGVGATSSYDTNNKLTLQGDDSVSPARQLVIRGNTDPTKRLNVGFDTTGNQATLQSYTAASTAGNLLLNPSGGNVGIGTTAPAFPLSFAATTGDKIALYPGTAPSSYGFGVAANALQIHGNGVTDSIVFGYGSSAAMTETMRIQGNGNVGIGTTAPFAKLTVAGGGICASGTNVALTVANAATTKALDLAIADSAGAFSTSAAAGDAVIRTSASSKMHLQTGSGGAAGITLDSSNNVGIGTSTPAYKLDVNGTARVASNVYLNNNSALFAPNTAGTSQAVFWPRADDNGTYLNYGTNGFFIRNNASFVKMYITDGGYVGIGTTSPSNLLSVESPASARTTATTVTSSAAIAHIGASDSHTYFGSYDSSAGWGNWIQSMRTWDSYAFNLILNPRGGNVGIGTASPLAPLHVAGSALNSFTLDAYLDGNGVNNVWEARSDLSHSIIADGRVRAFAFDIASDLRIKNVQKISEGGEDLATLMKIEITDYLYKDIVAKGKRPQKKVIAQQVEKVYPQAVIQSTDVVPDLYKKAAVKDGWIELATDLKVGERVKLIGKQDQSVHVVLEVRDGAFRTDGKVDAEHVFVYGREVKDFRSVDYDAIAMLNVSATQQVKREKDAEIQALRDENAALRRDLAAKDESVEARLIAIEQRLSKGSAPETVSIKTANAAK